MSDCRYYMPHLMGVKIVMPDGTVHELTPLTVPTSGWDGTLSIEEAREGFADLLERVALEGDWTDREVEAVASAIRQVLAALEGETE